jgi:beta-N-acetylhexosaminidase
MDRAAIGQHFVLGFEGREVSPGLAALLRDWVPGGVILFGGNLGSPAEIAALTEALQAAAPVPLFIAVDQEGGRVARLGPPATQWPSPSRMAAGGAPELTYEVARAMARELRALGITMNLAPVLDVLTEPANPVISSRSFGAEPRVVAQHGSSYARGLLDEGIVAIGKHFPGHGDTIVDSHLALPLVPHDLPRLFAVELVPFVAAVAAGIPGLMTAHLLVPALDAEWPATLSRPILTGLLRERLGFSGLVMSDDLLMRGITDRVSVEEAAIRFLDSGGDLILICSDEARQRAALDAVAEAVETGRLPEARISASRGRITAVKARYLPRAGRSSVRAIDTVIGCEAHRRLAERLGADRRGEPPEDP